MPLLFRGFFAVAIAEACSWAGLLAGMYVEHLGSGDKTGVEIFGPIHGGLFIAYCVGVLLVARELDWGPKQIFVGLACSVPPFTSVWFERRADRRRRARDAQREPAPALT
ncbi:MAG: DUF3817 domain-containing protein [Stackebrandtia sp.]